MVLVLFPFTDQRGAKLRPAVVAANPSDADAILCMVTTQLARADQWRTRVIIGESDTEYEMTGLRASSAIRPDKIVTVRSSLVLRRLGHLGPRHLGELRLELTRLFGESGP